MMAMDTFGTQNIDDGDRGSIPINDSAQEHVEEILHLDNIEMPFLSSGEDPNAYSRRFLTLFRDVSQGGHYGGSGFVEKVTNAQGEVFALKRISYAVKTKLIDEDRYKKTILAQQNAFRKEYENQQRLSEFKGFPRLYGYGSLEGEPVILMEWIDGKTLGAVKYEMALNHKTQQWSPKNISTLGVSLYSLLSRMDCLEDNFIHRDISLNNIMFKTTEKSVAEQFEQGDLDLYLIDFGSSSSEQLESPSFTVETNVVRKGTPEYAPPEMLSTDLSNLAALRSSPSIDVYAVGSILYELFCGRTPYNLSQNLGIQSYYRFKVEAQVPTPQGVHSAATRYAHAGLEGETERFYREMREDFGADFDEPRFFESLRVVDRQLGFIIMQALSVSQEERPSAEKMCEMIETFQENYYINIERRYSGEKIIPFSKPLPNSKRIKMQLRVTAPSLGQPTILRAQQDVSGAVVGYGPPPAGSDYGWQGGGVTAPGQVETVSGAKVAGVMSAVVAVSLILAFFICMLIKDFSFTVVSSGSLLSMNLSSVAAAFISLVPVLLSLLFSWFGTKPGAKLFTGTLTYIIAAGILLAFTYMVSWQSPSASAGIGFIFVLDALIVFVCHFYLYSVGTPDSKRGSR